MPFSDLDALTSALTDSTREVEVTACIDYRIGASTAAALSIRWNDLAIQNSTRNGCIAAPGTTPRNPTRTTAGSLRHTPPAVGHELYVSRMAVSSAASAGLWVLYDRLGDVSGLDGTSTSAQTISGGGVTEGSRYTNPEGNLAFVEIFGLVGTTATTFTVSYTNQDGVSGRTSHPALIGGTGYREVGKLLPIPLVAGDTAIKSVQSITLAASTGLAGDLGVVIVKPLKTCAAGGSGLPGDHGFLVDGVLSHVPSDACLCYAAYFVAASGSVNCQALVSVSLPED